MNEELKQNLQEAGKAFSIVMINLLNDAEDEKIQDDKRIIAALKEVFLLMNYVYVVSNNLTEVADDLGYTRLEKTTEALQGLKEVREELFQKKQEQYKNLTNYPDYTKYHDNRKAIRESNNVLKLAAEKLVRIERLCKHITLLEKAYRQYIDDAPFLDAELKNSRLEKVSKLCKWIPFLSRWFS